MPVKKILVLFITTLVIGSDAMASSKLTTYRKRRGLSKKTKLPEPYGDVKKTKSKEPMFVIQKHDASHLHYDFRLEIDGVLVSWAVPKGLPATTKERRLAIPTDDHPMEYGDFEGIIPEGHYGGGTVMVWDIGTYENLRALKDKKISMSKAHDEGTIEVFLKGKKLWGPYAIVKTKGLYAKDSWMVIKMKHDELGLKKPKKRVKKDLSALTGRTLAQIAKDRDAEWD